MIGVKLAFETLQLLQGFRHLSRLRDHIASVNINRQLSLPV